MRNVNATSARDSSSLRELPVLPGARSVARWLGRWVAVFSLLVLPLLTAWSTPANASPEAARAGAGRESVPGVDLPPSHVSHGGDTPRSGHAMVPPVPDGFSTFDGGWIKLAYHPSLAARVRVLVDQADEFKQELRTMLGVDVLGQVHVRVGRTAGEMETLAPEGTSFPKYAAGVAYSELSYVLLTAAPRYPGAHHDLGEVFRHELAHIALHDAVTRDAVPRWFNEGFAVHASGEASTARLQALWTATVSGNLIPFSKLSRSFPADATSASVAYAQAADLSRFLLRRGEEHRFRALIRRLGAGQAFEGALSDSYATDMYSLETDWKKDVAQRYTFWPILFGGSFIWVGALGLLIWGYVRRKRRADAKLARWEREEALEDARRKWALSALSGGALSGGALSGGLSGGALSGNVPSGSGLSATVIEQGGQVRVVVTGAQPSPQDVARARARSGDDTASPLLHVVPSVEHEGQRHTLH